MQLTIPKGSKITQTEGNTIELKVPNTKFWVLGEQKPTKKWDVFLIDNQNGYKSILRKDATTKSFSIFSNIILKTPFPYSGKKAEDANAVKRFIKKITK